MQPQKKRIARTSSDKVVAGVLGGIASYYNINPFWLRIGFVLATTLSAGILVVGYTLAVILMPNDRN